MDLRGTGEVADDFRKTTVNAVARDGAATKRLRGGTEEVIVRTENWGHMHFGPWAIRQCHQGPVRFGKHRRR